MSSVWLKALVLVSLFGAVMIIVERLVANTLGKRFASSAVNKRLEMIERGVDRAEAMRLLKRQDPGMPSFLPGFLSAPIKRLEQVLMASGTTIDTTRLVVVLLLAPVGLFLFIILLISLVGSGLGAGQILMLAAFSILAGAAMPIMFFSFKANRRRRKMEEQFPVALDVFVRGLRAGHPVTAALELLTTEMADPIGSQFGVVVDEVTYGADLRDALDAMAERWDLEDMRMFVVSLSIQNETGGNLAEILENLAKVIRERASMMMKVRALTSEGRMTATVLTVLPIGTFLMLFMFQSQFYLDVADDPLFIPGFVMLIVLYLIGFFWIRKMIDLKV